jgi:phosphatidylinositol alpha 1,6-mannosyltransferase
MKIAIFTDTFYPQVNGVANTLNRLGEYLESANIENLFIVPETQNDDGLPYNVLSFFSAPFILYPQCRFTFPNTAMLNKHLDDFKPDIILLMTEFNVGLMGLKYAKSRKIPVVSNYSTNFSTILKSYHLSFFVKILNAYLGLFHNAADHTITPSDESRKVLNQLGVHEVSIFGRGINTHSFSPSFRSVRFRESTGFDDRILLLYVGRLSAEKDLDLLRSSMIKLNTIYKQKIALIVTGDGPMKAELENTMPDNVFFTGVKMGKDLSEVYASCDIFAFPSAFETFGNVVLEAYASGLSVVGVNQGGVVHLINHGVSGYLSSPKDVDDFSYYLEKLILSRELREQFSNHGRHLVQSRSWDQVFSGLFELFDKTIIRKNTTTKRNILPESRKRFGY